MSTQSLAQLYASAPVIAEMMALRGVAGELTVTAPTGIRPALLSLLAGPSPLVVVTATGRDGEELATALRERLGEHAVGLLPAWETLPHERLSPRSDTVAARLTILRRLAHPDPTHPELGPLTALVIPARALLQPVATGLGDLVPVELTVGQVVAFDEVVEALAQAAYARVDMVERRGEFAVRGGIIDVFPPTAAHPLRVEFWGDEVSEIRQFSVADQRSLAGVEYLVAPPTREFVLTDAVRARARELVRVLPGVTDMLDKIAAGVATEGMESLMPALVDLEPVVNLLPADCLVVVTDPERVRRRAKDLVDTTNEFLTAAWHAAAVGGTSPVDLQAASFLDVSQAHALARQRGLTWWNMGPFAATDEPAPAGDTALTIAATDSPTFGGDVSAALEYLATTARAGWVTVVTTAGAGSAKRIVEQLREADVPAHQVTTPSANAGVVQVVTAATWPGFRYPELKLAVLSEPEITGRPGSSTRDMRKLAARRRASIDPLALRAGDFVVHDTHGIARFVELAARVTGKGEAALAREYLVLEYAPSKRGQPGDRLYVPSDQLHLVSRYSGGEAPALSSLGGQEWAKAKGRARKAVREIAAELIRLYSARQATQGRTFGPDTVWQRELEDAFAYVETPDQLVTIDEVKADMEKTVPMDRLISGDVGYGKTEIAVRAAFKAVQDGAQVAVLVPTTLLVQQHFQTFSERYAPFGVQVAALSRFQSDAQARATLEDLAAGTIDVVIGTHRLLTGAVRFKDLGLVIVDEEQRFGVEHKETLKALRTNVDVLSMSATPIPRTLEMAITGIREMSTLATPPEERHPVLTYVGPTDDTQIAAAIRRELLREGQVFFVHNRVAGIEKLARHLQELVPEARIATAHGKMSERQLEQVIVDFWERRFDVLVSTTIVETGLDIANANTLIVDHAEKLGLSQMHQLRGRVGRGRERAYAYFLYDPARPLTETAHERLATIAANTELGSGMAVAMKDLEIRGAGNLLGAEQSGHIEGVGFDMYVRMVGEAVAAFKGEKVRPELGVRIELPVDARVPQSYIGSDRLRLDAYRKIGAAANAAELDEVVAELTDRFGSPGDQIESLFQIARLRWVAAAAGVSEVTMQGTYLRLAGVVLAESMGMRVRRIYPGTVLKPAARTVLIPLPKTAALGGAPIHGAQLLDFAGQVLQTFQSSPLATAGAGQS